MQSSTARLLLEQGDQAGACARLRTVEATSRTALREVRQLLGVLRDDQTTRSPSPGAADLDRLVQTARDDGLDVTLEVDAPELPAAVGLAVFRIVQESLTNVRRHAPDAVTTVRVAVDDGALEVSVCDVGAEPPAPGGSGHGRWGSASASRRSAGR